jgi:hypothetical protein
MDSPQQDSSRVSGRDNFYILHGTVQMDDADYECERLEGKAESGSENKVSIFAVISLYKE